MKTNPNIPNGAKLITHLTACVTAFETSAKNSFVLFLVPSGNKPIAPPFFKTSIAAS